MNPHVYTDLLRDSIERHRDRPALHVKREGSYRSWSYGDLHRDLNRCASALRARKYGDGFTAALIGANSPEWVIAYHGIVLAGGKTVPIDPNIPADQIRTIIEATGARAVFCTDLFAPLFHEMRRDLARLTDTIILDGPGFGRFLDEGEADIDAFDTVFSPDDPMVIIFTSGTTGNAKGVVLCQKNFTAVIRHAVPRMKVGPGDTMCAILPLHHVFGFAACVAALLGGGMDAVFVPVIKGPLILEALNERRVSILPAVPQMLEALYESIERGVREKGAAVIILFTLLKGVSILLGPFPGRRFRAALFATVHRRFGGRLRLFVSGGSSLKKRYFTAYRRMGFNIVEGYGLTETFGPITICPIGDQRQGSVGPVLEENEMSVLRPDRDGIGEVLFRGITVFAGYYNNRDATNEVFDEQGWFHTGDLGRIDRTGFLYITGRIKDIVVLSSGKNVYPEELEEIYGASPLIEEIGVFGMNNGKEETVVALIVPARDIRRTRTADQARAILHRELTRMMRPLPSYKRISDFMISYAPLPRTTTKKLKKHELRSLFAAHSRTAEGAQVPGARLSAAETILAATPLFRKIIGVIHDVSPDAKKNVLSPRSLLDVDAKLDSLKRLEAASLLEERLGVAVADEAVARCESIGDLAALIEELRGENAGGARAPSPGEGDEKKPVLPAQSPGLLLRAGCAPLRAASRALWGLRIEGAPVCGSGKPVLFCANHESYLDGAWLIAALPWPLRRATFIIGKIELARHPLFRWIISRGNMIAVERQGNVADALNTAHACIESGKNLIIFPEGTRTRTGRMGPFKPGIGTLVCAHDVTVQPVRIRNACRVWPADEGITWKKPRDNPPALIFGAPVDSGALRGRAQSEGGGPPDPRRVARLLREMIMEL